MNRHQSVRHDNSPLSIISLNNTVEQNNTIFNSPNSTKRSPTQHKAIPKQITILSTPNLDTRTRDTLWVIRAEPPVHKGKHQNVGVVHQ
jgi:hypothetical protein